jgi:hypothetical protein
MFEGVINRAKSAAGSMVAKYLARASVAVPFLVALGFATAAVTLMLVERFGAITAYWSVAAGFAVIGLLATLVVTAREHMDEARVDSPKAEPAQAKSAPGHAGAETSAAFADALNGAPVAILGTLVSSSLGRIALAGGLKIGLRNLPLILMLAAIGLLLWPDADAREDAAVSEPRPDTPSQPAHESRRAA